MRTAAAAGLVGYAKLGKNGFKFGAGTGRRDYLFFSTAPGFLAYRSNNFSPSGNFNDSPTSAAFVLISATTSINKFQGTAFHATDIVIVDVPAADGRQQVVGSNAVIDFDRDNPDGLQFSGLTAGRLPQNGVPPELAHGV